MKREIKFRAFHNRANKMLESGINRQIFSWKDEGHDITIMQYTGLKDKNGVEIYEGDIMNGTNQVIKVVEWDIKRAAFVYIEQFKPKGVRISFAQMYDKFRTAFYKDGILPNHEVIGNIYQHPQLLTHDTDNH